MPRYQATGNPAPLEVVAQEPAVSIKGVSCKPKYFIVCLEDGKKLNTSAQAAPDGVLRNHPGREPSEVGSCLPTILWSPRTTRRSGDRSHFRLGSAGSRSSSSLLFQSS